MTADPAVQPAAPTVVIGLPAALATAVEKIVWTYIQAFTGLLGVGSAFDFDLSVAQMAAISALPAALTAIVALLPQVQSQSFYADLTFRVLRTFVAVFLGTAAVVIPQLLADGAREGDVWKGVVRASLAAAGAAVFSIVKGAAAGRVGVPHTAATLPASLDASPPAIPHMVGTDVRLA